MTNCGTMTATSPSSAFSRSALAAAPCFSLRSTKTERKTFASTTTRCMSDAPSSFASFVNGLHHVIRAVLDEAYPPPERWPLGRDLDTATFHLPHQFVAGFEVECVAYLFRYGGLALTGHRGVRHFVSLRKYTLGKENRASPFRLSLPTN